MIRREESGVQWLEFELFAGMPGIVHGILLRQGGEENRDRMLRALRISQVASCIQVHGDRVIHEDDGYQSTEECDGMITKTGDLALMIKHADCQAAIFYDPVHRALANVHAGWRGNVKNIYRATVEKMGGEFGTRPEDLLVGISPSLGPKNAEFRNFRVELPEEFWGFQSTPTYFDLWAIARMQLEQCGIAPHHIEIAGMCTVEQHQDFYSYRRDKAKCRNNATFAMLTAS